MRPGTRLFTSLAAAAGWCLAVQTAFAGQVQSVSLDNGATGTRAEIRLQGSGGFSTLSLANPNRLVVDLPDSSAAKGLKLPAGGGVVSAVRTGHPVPGTLRIVFDLSSSVVAFKPQMQTIGGSSVLVIEWPGEAPSGRAVAGDAPAAATPVPQAAPPVPAPKPAVDARAEAARATAALTSSVVQRANQPAPTPVPPPVAPAPAPTVVASAPSVAAAVPGRPVPGVVPAPATVAPPANDPSERDDADDDAAVAAAAEARPVMPSAASRVKMAPGMRPLIVAIDPGHGGQDPGASGPSGKHEKDVTLAIGRELARQINATPGMKAYMTRTTDVFIPLPMRAQKARAAKADIFISIHADAAENRSATGSSVYVLSTKGASSQRARWLADKENAADLIGGVRLQKTDSTLANVLLDLAQSGHMKASEDAAGHVLGGLKRIGNNHKPEIERANFAVLRTSDMPAMLVETAFISNPDEERRLTDPAYQRRIAGAVLDGVSTFFTRQPPPGTLFAARAQAEAEAASTVAGGSR
ncbi:N-acetylmuramoyl-L-alanine amidase [Xanthomonas rydalmerensis]|uniref:N-acetylmuramoyl-L-alanine amidase n=1 Tax=Xanthomonas rydalmerensis TaxID=3046274 RepID=A0ABZ0JTJ6_9XANT|nr:N-acetylmuramoyl-L-alanine amidase [Xanthomonas sp. DM-2023]WOS42427.1 N-acetylmuramoyl-L-alanine amidase [Xanthomonas sp. DM-2023]WOS46613.1 N-acetylmuramoyl-L-alanine amidase [Xanthomonas sp. DM-2023]WOS50793.1 N-acetylmuramoyl-L-alanine amidase [Xanthomonas sp. DM-2023]WOS54973.1 N-acetylmuramoyl-L-alanine amidase [Xanthomonas sp. DM-2023]WOS59155.1 N-acetylmuramoyl-L-alanine amidase [Xanthomonas sp. DM-2023]